jgi:hypothetical protein
MSICKYQKNIPYRLRLLHKLIIYIVCVCLQVNKHAEFVEGALYHRGFPYECGL